MVARAGQPRHELGPGANQSENSDLGCTNHSSPGVRRGGHQLPAEAGPQRVRGEVPRVSPCQPRAVHVDTGLTRAGLRDNTGTSGSKLRIICIM